MMFVRFIQYGAIALSLLLSAGSASAQLVKNEIKIGHAFSNWNLCIYGCVQVTGGKLSYHPAGPVEVRQAPPRLHQGSVNMAIQFDNGSSARYYPPRQQDMVSNIENTSVVTLHALGFEGMRYNLVFKNDSDINKFVCTAVDGRSIMNGRPILSLDDARKRETWGSCYLVRARNKTTVNGWRESDSFTRAFVMKSPEKSLAVRNWGDAGRVGAITVAVFDEQVERSERSPETTASEASRQSAEEMERRAARSEAQRMAESERRAVEAPAARKEAVQTPPPLPAPSLGTASGNRQHSPIGTVNIPSEPIAATIIVINYDSEPNLRTMGIVLDQASSSGSRMPRHTNPGDYIRFKE